jgi:alkylated DNA repair dioxygenase AlkB
MSTDLAWQPSLFDGADGRVRLDPAFARLRRHDLSDGAWVDVAPAWCDGADGLLARLLEEVPWGPQRRVRMYDSVVAEPRLTHRWLLGDDVDPLSDAAPPPELVEMAEVLGRRYGVSFTQVGANLYRDGADSVAWHRDRVHREMNDAVIAIVSIGAPRPFRLRPHGGGPSIGFDLGHGDLLVMGGTCQRTWEHTVPKVARAAGPRLSVTFRHDQPGRAGYPAVDEEP